MNSNRIPIWAVVLFILLVIIAVALWLRMALPNDQVFAGPWVKLTGVDTYYMMRLVDNLVSHFPNLTQFDPYNIFPGGARTNSEPNLFIYLMGGIIWLLGMGRPDQHLADVIGVYIPPVLAALTVLTTFFIGKTLKNVWTGLLAAGLLAILPGEFLNRSLLGYTDYHIAESLTAAAFILFAMLAFKNVPPLDFVKERGWGSIVRPLVYSILAGLALATYMLVWAGAALFVLILFVFVGVQIIIDYSRGKSAVSTGAPAVIILLAALAFYFPGGRSYFSFLAVGGAVVLTAIMATIAEIMRRHGLKACYYVMAIVILGLAGWGLMYVLVPDTLSLLMDRLRGVFGWNSGTTIMEMQPMLLQQGVFNMNAMLGNFTSAVFLGAAGLVLITYKAAREPEPGRILLLIWSLFILLATLAMRRFSYYFAVNISILSSLFAWWVLELAGLGKVRVDQVIKLPEPRKKAARIRKARTHRSSRSSPVLMAVVLVIVLFVMVYPNMGPLPDGQNPAVDVARRPLFAPSDAWCESLDWLRQNTPEPLNDANAYYGLYKSPGEPGGYLYPGNAYGVLAWWDYGYWITRIGRRIPFSNPGTSATKGEAKFFLAEDEVSARRFIKDVNIRYVIVDDQIASYDSKFFALPTWIGSSYQDYYDVYLQKQGDKYVPGLLFYPAYYQTMVARLYNFDGKATVPAEVTVVSYEQVAGADGEKLKAITDTKKFSSYEEASQFVDSQKPKTYRIVGGNPYTSPVPLDALNNFKPIYSSTQQKTVGGATTPYIKIFEYRP